MEELVERAQAGRVLDPGGVEDERAELDGVVVGQHLADLGAERGERRGHGLPHAAVAAEQGGTGEGGRITWPET